MAQALIQEDLRPPNPARRRWPAPTGRIVIEFERGHIASSSRGVTLLHMPYNRNMSAALAAPPDQPAEVPCAAVRNDPVLAAAYDVLLDLGPGKATLARVSPAAPACRG